VGGGAKEIEIVVVVTTIRSGMHGYVIYVVDQIEWRASKPTLEIDKLFGVSLPTPYFSLTNG
jgi:hypothetical protein